MTRVAPPSFPFRVAERGTHAQLLRKGGLYAEMWLRQQSEREAEQAEAAE